MMTNLLSKKNVKGFITVFFICLLLSCGASQVDIEVGETKIERGALIEWNEKRTGVVNPSMSLLVETANEWIQNQALADFLSEYGAVFDEVEVIRVKPQAGMARVGGANFPKRYQQFEAIAYHNGPDHKPATKDDLELGMVDVAWSLEEYPALFVDDDKMVNYLKNNNQDMISRRDFVEENYLTASN